MDEMQARVVRAWVVDRLTLILDNNDEQRYEAIQQAARDAVLNDMGASTSFDSREAYVTAVRNGDLLPYAEAVGSRVTDLIAKWVESGVADKLIKTMVQDVLDLSDRMLQLLIGEHYLPEVSEFED